MQPEVWGPALVNINGDTNIMLESIRDDIFMIEGEEDISNFVKEYFKINGYDFNSQEEEEEEEEW